MVISIPDLLFSFWTVGTFYYTCLKDSTTDSSPGPRTLEALKWIDFYKQNLLAVVIKKKKKKKKRKKKPVAFVALNLWRWVVALKIICGSRPLSSLWPPLAWLAGVLGCWSISLSMFWELTSLIRFCSLNEVTHLNGLAPCLQRSKPSVNITVLLLMLL